MRFPIQLLWHVVLTILLLTSLLVSPSWQQQQQAPCLQAPRNNFSSRALIERAQNGAHLSPAVFLGTLRSVLVQRDGTVRSWFAVDSPLKMANGTSSRWTKGKRQDQEVVYYRTGSSCVLVLNQEQLKLGAQYLVYGAPLAGSRTSLAATALPIPNEKRTLRAVRRIVCNGCAKPPSIAGLTNVRVVEGGKTQLHCHLAGNPIPWVEWYKDGRKVVPTRGRLRVRTKRRTSRLVVRRARASDRGLYECRAGNVVQREYASARATLIVTRKPRRTTSRPRTTRNRPSTTPTPTLRYTASSLWTTEPCPNSNFCLNGGTCIFYKDVREYVCHCPDGFVGLRCHYKDVSISLGEMKNLGQNHDRLFITIVTLFVILFCFNWAALGICWLCCFRRRQSSWGSFQEIAPLREVFNRKLFQTSSSSLKVDAVRPHPNCSDESFLHPKEIENENESTSREKKSSCEDPKDPFGATTSIIDLSCEKREPI